MAGYSTQKTVSPAAGGLVTEALRKRVGAVPDMT